MPRRLGRLVRPVGLGPCLHRNRGDRHGVPCAPSPPKPFDLNLILPTSLVVKTISFPNQHALTDFLRSCNGTL